MKIDSELFNTEQSKKFLSMAKTPTTLTLKPLPVVKSIIKLIPVLNVMALKLKAKLLAA